MKSSEQGAQSEHLSDESSVMSCGLGHASKGKSDAVRIEEAEALNRLGLELASRDDVVAAADAFRRAIRICPGCVQARQNLGVALGKMGDIDGAIVAFRLAILADENYFAAKLNLATTLATLKRIDETIDAYHAALRLCPDSPEALNGLGLALTCAGRGAEAVIYLRQATRLKADFEGAQNNLGVALAETGRYDEAIVVFEKLLQLNPRYTQAHVNLGNAYKELGRLDEALVCYELAASLDSRNPSPRWNRALTLLQKGDMGKGWPEYEVRWERKEAGDRPRFEQPAWDGSSLEAKTIMVYGEQGLGDMLQFVRYASLLKGIGACRVIARSPAPLYKLLRSCRDVDEVVSESETFADFDVHVSVMSLPSLFRTELATVPTEVPYLSPDSARIEYWKERLAALPGMKIGIAWQGNPHHKWDRHRSVPLKYFDAIGGLQGVHLISLQRGPGVEQMGGEHGYAIHDLLDRDSGEEDALLDVAAIMKCVDLVITVDTLTAHLAGAMGIAVWVALSTMVDWRWMLNRDDSPWYPTMRLIRQKVRGEWAPVFAQMALMLAVERKLTGGAGAGVVGLRSNADDMPAEARPACRCA